MSDELAGVVLAAGLGSRLRPLTTVRPKALCPVGGVPLLDRALARVCAVTGGGPGQVAVNAHHLADQVARHVGDRAHLQVERPVALGTAGALGRLRGWVGDRDVLLTNADAYLPDGLQDLVEGWDRRRCRLLVRPSSRPGDFGGHDYVGACLLPRHLVHALTDGVSGLYEVLWRAEHDAGRLDLAVTAATAIDCGTPADYLAANLHASGGDSVVGVGARVLGTVKRCVVWDEAWVGPDEHLVDSIRAGSADLPVTVDASR